MVDAGHERRKYFRVETPLKIRIIGKDNAILDTVTKDISPIGVGFETKKDDMNINDELELKIEIPNALSPVHAKAKVVWKKKLSTENGAPFNIGCEFSKVEEDNKNTFLKYICDLLYERADTDKKKGE